MERTSRSRKPLVHLELHTRDLNAAQEYYERLCGWRTEPVRAGPHSYLAVELGDGVGGGIVECATDRPLWLPYAEVDEIHSATDQARELGASVLLDPREGPTGWRSVVQAAEGGEIAFWQPKDRRR